MNRVNRITGTFLNLSRKTVRHVRSFHYEPAWSEEPSENVRIVDAVEKASDSWHHGDRLFKELWKTHLRKSGVGEGGLGLGGKEGNPRALTKTCYSNQTLYDSLHSCCFNLYFISFLHLLSNYSLAAHSGLGPEDSVHIQTHFFACTF